MTDWRTEKIAERREKQRLADEATESRKAEEWKDYGGKFVDAMRLIGIPNVEITAAIHAATARASAIGIKSAERPSALFVNAIGDPDLLLQPAHDVTYGNVDLEVSKPCAECGRWVTLDRAFDPRPGYRDIGWILERGPQDVYHECGRGEGDRNFVPKPVPGEGNEPPTNEQRIVTALESIALALWQIEGRS